MSYILYVLAHTQHQKTYVGITNNPQRRLRQHNQELVGGARYTTSFKGDGEWYYYAKVHGLDKSTALSHERKMHSRRYIQGKTPIERRINKLNKLNLQYELCNELCYRNDHVAVSFVSEQSSPDSPSQSDLKSQALESCLSNSPSQSDLKSQALESCLSNSPSHNSRIDDADGLVTTVDPPIVEVDEVVPSS